MIFFRKRFERNLEAAHVEQLRKEGILNVKWTTDQRLKAMQDRLSRVYKKKAYGKEFKIEILNKLNGKSR